MYTAQDVSPITEGLEAIRRRPAMYIGVEGPGRSPSYLLIEGLVDSVADDTPRPREIRAGLWKESVITVAYDGYPLPIEPCAPHGETVLHPALYYLFMQVPAGARPFGRFYVILNALTERLVVSTTRDGQRYRAAFAKGMLVTLLKSASCRRSFGTTWFTFRPDTAIIGGDPVIWADMQAIAGRQGGTRICVEDHSEEEADWC